MSAPLPRTACGSMPLTLAWVPTGMKAGVATAPWGVAISPRRAAPSVASRRNWKGSGTGAPRGPKESCRSISGLPAEQQARISVGIEPVARRDRMCVGPLHHLETAKGADQHEQGRARQMEIGHYHVDRPEAVARGDEHGGFAGEWRKIGR